MALSRFVEVEELNHIRFSNLENNVLIKNSQVIIPVMDIQSNALDMLASGIHDFSNQYEYRLELKLSELLYSKARGAARRSEFDPADDESDTRTLFLKIYDNGSGPKVEWDREQAAKKIREDLKNEKSELKELLNRELGLFNRDEEVVQSKDPREDEEEIFRFEFSDDSDSIENEDDKDTERKRRRRRNSDTLQNKPATEFVIDE